MKAARRASDKEPAEKTPAAIEETPTPPDRLSVEPPLEPTLSHIQPLTEPPPSKETPAARSAIVEASAPPAPASLQDQPSNLDVTTRPSELRPASTGPVTPSLMSPPAGAPPEEAPVTSPSATLPAGADRATFFRAFEHEVEEEKRSRMHRLAVTAVVLALLAAYLFVPSVQRTINSGVLSVTHRLEQLFQPEPTTPAGEFVPLPQLEIVQAVMPRGRMVTIRGEVRNISSETFFNLFAEFALVRRDINLPETRLVPIQPATLPPNLQGQYMIEIFTDEFSEYRLARILTADKKEVTFRLSLAVPTATSPRQ